ncbi:TIGR04282 family arsenosugar biosynthesis glycosyltransferase [Sedimenticola hydrogenitrophicus]|uniref:TIGR04282 family arsenosugar biosynthesis glycosyltransferase n=1 Tax=Sedimenticola hydrogenitrophicus TaxID=2967975 RepID=UPI0023B181A4|nr:TIGR04282 family arsenosugar biosynthesis glycosyltransferase [Sedimenticola hydrogenitrophicus]
MLFPGGRILLFAKAPLPGQVKTRLIPAVGEQRAAQLYRELLERMIGEAAAGIAPVEIWCAPDTRHGVFREAASNPSISLHTQPGGDLGERMAFATRQALTRSEAVLLIGGDCPVLNGAHLKQAFAWLYAGSDAVLGPAEDGGYVLLGLRRVARELFAGIPWSTPAVLDVTRRRLGELNWSWREFEPLWDLDREADLDRYLRLNGGSQ